MSMLVIASILNRVTERLTVPPWWARPWSLYRHQDGPKSWGLVAVISLLLGAPLTACRDQAIATPRSVAIQQSWELAPGDTIEGFFVAASLGDISIHLDGAAVYAPFEGELELAATGKSCVFFSSPEVPAYLFRYCGLKRAHVGQVAAGQSIGKANYLHFATLRRQPEGTWVIVEPSTHVLERSLERS